MTDILKDAMAWLDMMEVLSISREVEYSRTTGGATDSCVLNATVGTSVLKVSDDVGNVRIVRPDRDYLVTAADLILGGAVTLPQRGDRIRDPQDDGTVSVYEVVAPSGEPEWRPSDPDGIKLRVHCKRIATEV